MGYTLGVDIPRKIILQYIVNSKNLEAVRGDTLAPEIGVQNIISEGV
jgi:hypothetical protein